MLAVDDGDTLVTTGLDMRSIALDALAVSPAIVIEATDPTPLVSRALVMLHITSVGDTQATELQSTPLILPLADVNRASLGDRPVPTNDSSCRPPS